MTLVAKAQKPRNATTPRKKSAVERLPERQKRLQYVFSCLMFRFLMQFDRSEITGWQVTARKSTIKNWKDNQIARKEKALRVQMEKMIAGAVIRKSIRLWCRAILLTTIQTSFPTNLREC